MFATQWLRKKPPKERPWSNGRQRGKWPPSCMLASVIRLGHGNLANLEANDRDAGYSTAGTAILVSIGGETAATAAAILSEDKNTMVADNQGWKGKRYTRTTPASESAYEAVVYSNVEPPTMGKKFGSGAAVTPAGAFEYQLTEGALPASSTPTPLE